MKKELLLLSLSSLVFVTPVSANAPQGTFDQKFAWMDQRFAQAEQLFQVKWDAKWVFGTPSPTPTPIPTPSASPTPTPTASPTPSPTPPVTAPETSPLTTAAQGGGFDFGAMVGRFMGSLLNL
jgi:hypothetical protein